MNEQQQQFQWGDLREKWWRESGASCRATDTQIKYACARHQGANKSKAATLAGYSGTPEALRSAGVRAEGSAAVEALLTLAAAAEDGGSKDGPVTAREIELKLSKLIRSPDGALALKAVEVMERREERRRNQDTTSSELDVSDEAFARCMLSLARPERAPIVWAETLLHRWYWHTPFLCELAPWMRANRPADWAVLREPLIGEYGQMVDQVVKLENGPVLSLDEIATRCGLKKPSTNGAHAPHMVGDVSDDFAAA